MTQWVIKTHVFPLGKRGTIHELLRQGFAAAFCLNNMQGIATRVSSMGSARQAEAFLDRLMQGRLVGAPSMSEPHAGSDLGQLSCSAAPVEGGWVLNGTKPWVTNGTIVDVLTVLCRVPRSMQSRSA